MTRTEGPHGAGWTFSHNSLREYLSVEHYIDTLQQRSPAAITVPITSAMRSFSASLPKQRVDPIILILKELWIERAGRPGLGAYLTLLWEALCRSAPGSSRPIWSTLMDPGTDLIGLNGIKLEGVRFSIESKENIQIDGSNSDFSEVIFDFQNLSESRFSGCTFDNCSFVESKLARVDFSGSLIFECDFTGADLNGADFSGIDKEGTILISDNGIVSELSGNMMLGHFRYRGANTDIVDDYYKYIHHPKFPIVFKILEKLSEQQTRDWRGLTQRGEAHSDPPFARDFVEIPSEAGVSRDGTGRMGFSDPRRTADDWPVHRSPSDGERFI